MGEFRHYFNKLYQSLKRPTFWIVTNIILIFLLEVFVTATSLTNQILKLLFVGFLIAILSSLIHSAKYKHHLDINWSVIFWGILNAWLLWFSSSMLILIKWVNYIVYLIIAAILIYFSHEFFKKVYPNNFTKVFLVIVMCVTVIIFVPPTGNEIKDANVGVNHGSDGNNLLSTLNNWLSSIANSANSCPQLNVPLEPATNNIHGVTMMIFVSNNTYKDWNIKMHTMTQFAIPITFDKGVPCVKGGAEGQNKNYWYCGSVSGSFFGMSSASQIPYVEKTLMASDGTIGKTVRKSFRNIYDGSGNFIRTECDQDPVELDKRNVEELANWLIK